MSSNKYLLYYVFWLIHCIVLCVLASPEVSLPNVKNGAFWGTGQHKTLMIRLHSLITNLYPPCPQEVSNVFSCWISHKLLELGSFHWQPAHQHLNKKKLIYQLQCYWEIQMITDPSHFQHLLILTTQFQQRMKVALLQIWYFCTTMLH